MDRKPTVFLDRDGTINYDAGYINDTDNFVIYPFAAQSIKMLNDSGYLVVVITNQSGLGRGFFNIETMNKIHEKMYAELAKQGAKIDGLYYCPHDVNAKVAEFKGDCDCRKPKAGMLEQAFSELPIDKSNTFFVGDKHSDIMAGYTFGSKTIMVETGYGKGDLLNKSHKWEVKPDYVAQNLLEATRAILTNKI